MKYEPYNFKKEDAYDFARRMGIQTYERGDELHFKKCPYCNQLTKDEKTFAISLRTGQFKCLRTSCGASGNMIKLSQDFGFSLGNEVDEYYKPTRNKVFRSRTAPPIVPKDKAIAYLNSRGISERVAKEYEITIQSPKADTEDWEKERMEKTLVFPFYDENGDMVYIKYRNMEYVKGVSKGGKEWSEGNGKPILFGMKQCDYNVPTLIFTEGQMDSLSVAEAGYKNAVSVPNGSKGMTWVPYCWNFIHRFQTIIVFGDYEKGHITLLDAIKARFNLQIKHVREEDYKDCKDANDILLKYGVEQIKTCIENAEDVPIDHVIDLSTVEDINPFEIEKLPTGFAELDTLLYGGLPFGGITLMTGKSGEGKSTVASQIIINAIENGHRCFCYSGELPNHLFKSWMTYQVAGSKHIFKYQTRWGDEGYNISAENRKQIDQWYQGKICIYDSSSISENDDSLLDIAETVVSRNAVDVVLIDNLMTALDLDPIHESDKYERQSKFMKKLTRIALKYKILVILVAHKRKNNYSKNSNDEVSGSSDIVNLASVNLSYGVDEELKPEQRMLSLTKNRLFGKTGSWIMDYDEKSKRVYGAKDNKDRDYGWNTEIDEDNPFT